MLVVDVSRNEARQRPHVTTVKLLDRRGIAIQQRHEVTVIRVREIHIGHPHILLFAQGSTGVTSQIEVTDWHPGAKHRLMNMTWEVPTVVAFAGIAARLTARAALAWWLAGAVLLSLPAGCARHEDPQVATAHPSAAGAVTPADERERAVQFARCMREAGVEVDDPDTAGVIKVKPADKTDPDFPGAIERCKNLMPRGAAPSAVANSAEQMEKLLEYARCMRDNGVPDFPDPGPNGFATAPKDQAAADRARAICAPIVGLDPRATGGAG